MKRLFAMSAVLVAMLISQRLSAQVDFSYISDGESISKLTAIFGQPIDRIEHEWGNDETYVTVKYTGCTATVHLQDNYLEGLIFWTSDIALFPSIVPGGIKVGDNISKFKDIDFSKEVTGKHYEPAGFIPSRYQSKCNSSDAVYNYLILSRAEPFRASFATENGIIREITVDHPVDAYNPNEDEETGATNGGLPWWKADLSSIWDDGSGEPDPRLLLAADNTKMFMKKPETALQMFIYLDSDVCQKCIFLNKIHWLDFFELSKESGGSFRVDYIVEPGDHKIRMLAEYVKLLDLKDVVYYGKEPSFNEEIQSRPGYRRGVPYVFMLDDKDNVQIVGDPDSETSMWEKYKEVIKSKTGLELWKRD